jgi:hypothetical protein
VITYGIAHGNGPMHILRPDGIAYCGVKRAHPFNPGYSSDRQVHRRCEIAHKAALKAIPPRSQAEVEAERRALRAEISDALLRFGIVW